MKFESENGCIEFVDQLPIFVATYIGEQELHQLSAFLDWSTEVFFSRKKRVAYVVDVTQLKSFSSWHRRAQAD